MKRGFMNKTISQTELNRNFKKYEKEIKKKPFYVFKNNKPAFVTVPVELFEELTEAREDIISIATKRYLDIKTNKVTTIKGKDAWKEI